MHRILKVIVLFIVSTDIHHSNVIAQKSTVCPSQKLILPCRCAQKSNEIQIWCSHSDLPRVLAGIKSVARFIDAPIDELILENNQLPSLPSRFFAPLRIVRLMLRNNGVERLATSWLTDLESHLVEIFIVERALRSFPFDSLVECKKLEAVTIHSNHLKRAPSFLGLHNLRYIKIEGNELMELPPYGFSELHTLENVYINSSPKLNRLEAGVFQNLDQLQTLNVNGNGISWVHLRAFTNLPTTHSIDLSHNAISDATMIGRSIKNLPKLEILRLDHNFITTLNEGTFVDFEYLKELYLNDNAIADIHYGAFHKMPNLKLLHLERNYLRRIHPESFLQTSGSGVEYLHLQYNDIANIEEVKSLLDALPILKFLDLSYNKLEEIPFGSLRGHGSLEQLYLDHNNIHRIERDAFMAMPALRELHLKNNSLTENMPLPFWNLPGLKGLDLSSNNIAILNETLLIGLPALRRLDVSNNQLAVIDPNSFANNLYLETINISTNSLVDIHPITFRALNRLFEIDVSFNSLNEFIGGLPRIVERINIEGNKIIALPNTSTKLLDLPNLRMLNMGGNSLNKIPPNAFKMLQQLRILGLAENRLRTIDEHNFDGLSRLEILNLQDNNLVALHERGFVPLIDLRELNVQGNRIEALLDSFSQNAQLVKFDASRNSISEIASNTFANCRQLEMLDLSHNTLKELPQSLSTLAELRDVDISFNQLTFLPSDIITAWRKIEFLKASDNKVAEIPQNTFIDLPELQYLDLSSNELKIIGSGSMRNLPELQELVLADNQLVELGENSFDNLPNLQALHLQNNFLRYISPKSFFLTNSVVYLNLSYNNFENMEHMGLRNVRNLEVLDLSGNKVRRIATNPLRNLDWLVELKLDDNHICKVQGEPFSSMPRLKVLTMRNNRMVSVVEPTFRHLRGNLATLDLDGNPLECSCDVLWLRAWYQEMNKYPGPRCRDGNLLTEMRFSKSDCDISNDSRMNQVLMTNEHGDVFKRQINFDECESDNQYTDTETVPSSPNESEYFYEQYIDYPLNDTVLEAAAGDTVYDKRLPNAEQSPFSRNTTIIRNDTLLNYDKHKLQQLHTDNKSNGGSRFTFFGMPLPNLGSIWSSDTNTRKSTSRSDNMVNGKSRLRNFRLRPGEIVDNFQYSNDIQGGQRRPLPNRPLRNDAPANIQPPPLPSNEYPNYQNPYTVPAIEKGGFVPMVPGRKGFHAAQDSFANETDTPDDVQETVSTELRPNINTGFDEHLLNDEVDNRYSILVPTVTPNSSIAPHNLNVSSLKKDENVLPTKSLNGISLFRTSAATTNAPQSINLTADHSSDVASITLNAKKSNGSMKSVGHVDHDKNYVQKNNDRPVTIVQTTTIRPEVTSLNTPFYPTFLPNTSDVINLSKNRPANGSSTAKNALSALVAPGAQQNGYRTGPPGRSKITKVSNSTRANSFVTPTTHSAPPTTTRPIFSISTTQKLPAAEEFLRTTIHDEYLHDSTTTASHIKARPVDNTLQAKSVDMEWYFNNYNKSTWKEPQLDPGLYRFRSNGNSYIQCADTKTHFTTLILTLALYRSNFCYFIFDKLI